MHTSLMLAHRHTHTHTQCNQNVCSHTDKSADVFGIFLLFYSPQFQIEHKGVGSLKVKILSLCSDQFVSVLKTFVCTVEIQGCVSEIQFPFMQFGFLLIVGAFCTLIQREKNQVIQESEALQTDNCIPLKRAVSKFTLNTNSITLLFTSYQQHNWCRSMD